MYSVIWSVIELVLGNMNIIYKSKHKGLLGVVECWYTCVLLGSLMSFIQAGGDPGQEC